MRLIERHARPSAAVVSVTRQFDFSPLSAAVNPADGQLYVTGFKIYGSGAKRVSGLARVRYTGRPSGLPREVVPATAGVLLRFDVELAPEKALDLANYAVERWNYRRTAAYGSPHYKLDGTKGQDRLEPASIYLSRDRRAVFLGLPAMRTGVMQMQLAWKLSLRDGTAFENLAHFTPFALAKFDPVAEGFEPLTVDLTPRRQPATAPARLPPTRQEGERLALAVGCAACHTITGAAQLGPSWLGLFGSKRTLANGTTVVADEAYLRESITEPAAKVVPGFEAPMPSYGGILDESQVESLVLYIKGLP